MICRIARIARTARIARIFQGLGIDPIRQRAQQPGVVTHMVVKAHWRDAQSRSKSA